MGVLEFIRKSKKEKALAKLEFLKETAMLTELLKLKGNSTIATNQLISYVQSIYESMSNEIDGINKKSHEELETLTKNLEIMQRCEGSSASIASDIEESIEIKTKEVKETIRSQNMIEQIVEGKVISFVTSRECAIYEEESGDVMFISNPAEVMDTYKDVSKGLIDLGQDKNVNVGKLLKVTASMETDTDNIMQGLENEKSAPVLDAIGVIL